MMRERTTRTYRSVVTAGFITSVALVCSFSVFGQSTGQEEDGPGQGVARISLLNGDVTVRRGDSGDWVAAAINAPLLVEDRVVSGPDSRAEVQLDYYDRIRLAGDTEVRFSELDWRKYQVQLARGTTIFSALPGTDDQIEFATPAASLRPLSAGSYRMTVMDDGTVEFTVRQGEAEIYTPHGTRRLTPGRTMRLHLSPDNIPEFQFYSEAPRDWFDEFSEGRDQELQHVKSYQYVSRDIPGAEDLDNSGEWVNQEPYGWTWRPYVAPDWAPYREGRWVWADDSYGWTWVSYDPWGWAPYHYGRWFCNAGVWFWYPGALWRTHYWSPGLVAFFGYGGFGVGVGFGGLGWVPLAPFETYHPWYGRHGAYGRYHALGNVNIASTYRNARVHNAVSGLSTRDFGHSAGVRAGPVASTELARTSVMRGSLPIGPSRGSLRMSDREVSGSLAARAARSSNARFISSRPAPASSREPFGSRASAVRSSGYGSSSAAGFRRASGGESGQAQNPGPVAGRGVPSSESQRGWTRAGGGESANGRARGTGGSGAASSSTREERSGWGSFGVPAGERNSTAAGAPASRSSSQDSNTRERGGWTSFGSPQRGSASTNHGAWSTGSGPDYRQADTPSRGPNATGGRNSGAEPYSRGASGDRSGYGQGGSTPRGAYSGSSSGRGSASGGSGGSPRQSSPAPSRSGGSGGGGGSHGSGGPSHR